MKYGLIGCGMMAQEHIRNIALLPDARVSCVLDPVAELAQVASDLAGGAIIAATLADLVAQVDAVVIVSPNHLHLRQLHEIAALRQIPILCEKPLFTDPQDLVAVKTFEQSYTAPVWVAMEYRYMPPVARLIEQADLETGGIKMMTIREHRFPFLPKVGDWNRFNRYSGGTLVEKCCHFFDLMRFTLAAEPVRIAASAGQMNNHLEEDYNGETPDIWDGGYVIVDFDNGARAMLELCMFAEGSRYQEEISALGPKGKIECFVPGPGRFWPKQLGAAPVPQVVVSPRHPKGPRSVDIPVDPKLLNAGDHNGSTFYQHERFLAAAKGIGPVEVSLTDGRRAVEMGLAAQKAAQEGSVVSLS